MITVYFIDDFRYSVNNGLATYTHAISNGILAIPDVRFINVWINSTKYQRVQKEFKKGGYELHIPDSTDQKAKYFHVFKCLESDIREKQQVIIHFNWIGHLSIAWFFKKYTKYITILTLHCITWRDFVTDDFDEFYKMDTAFQNNQPIKKLCEKINRERILYESIDHFITVTNVARKSLGFFFRIPTNKITTIRNGLDVKEEVDKRSGKKEVLRLKYGIASSDKVLLYVGTVSKRKGVIDLAIGFERYLEKHPSDNVKLVIIGDGKHGEVMKVCKKYWSKIIFTGPLTKEQIYDFYILSDIGIVPSYIEQCSYTAIEMMLFSLPMIVSNTDGLSEMVQSDSGLKTKIQFDKKKDVFLDLHELCQNIAYLLNNTNQATKKAYNANKNALKRFSVSGMIGNTTGVYRRILDNIECTNFQENCVKPIYIKKEILPKVSVILPFYNVEEYLQGCLESIFCQSFQDFELILIDGGSCDKSSEIVKNIDDSRLIYLQNKQNIGLADCLNKGILNAKGKYISGIGSSDLMAEQRLKLQISFLDKHDDYGLVGSYHEMIDHYGMVINRIEPPTEHDELKLGMLFKNQILHSGVTMRTDIVQRFKYSNKFKHCVSYDLWTKIIKVSKISTIPDYLLLSRIQENNMYSVNYHGLKSDTLQIISNELSNLNIFHTKEDLDLHSAFIFGNAKRIFNDDAKKHALQVWIDRILNSSKVRAQFEESLIYNYRQFLLDF